MQRIEIMDQTGYDAVWLAEHHFTTYNVCPSVHMMGLHAHCDDMARKVESYQTELAAHGYKMDGRDIPMAQLIAVAQTDAEAEGIARRGAQWMVGSYTIDPIQHYLDGVVIYGTPERVYDEIQRRRETMYLDYLMCAPLSRNSFMMFTEKVLPRLQ